ncbi:MAG: hypothetical protein WBV39_08650 [Rudaea sp.]
MFKTFCFCICLGAAPLALAASPMVAHPLAPSPHPKSKSDLAVAKPAALRRFVPPMVNVTRVVRGADGRLVMQCVQRPNPALRQRTVLPRN